MEKQRSQYLKNEDLVKELLICQQQDRISEKLYFMFAEMANRFSFGPTWRNHPSREEMVEHATNWAAERFHKFDGTKSTNAFSYYTRIIENAFRRFANDENRHKDIYDELKRNVHALPDWLAPEGEPDRSNEIPDNHFYNEKAKHGPVKTIYPAPGETDDV